MLLLFKKEEKSAGPDCFIHRQIVPADGLSILDGFLAPQWTGQQLRSKPEMMATLIVNLLTSEWSEPTCDLGHNNSPYYE